MGRMRIIKQIKYLLLLIGVLTAQQAFQIIDNVSDEFVKKYNSERHEYNPLHLGNYWQYASESGFLNEYIEKDTIVNDQRYFKKNDHRYQIVEGKYPFYNWERNDTVKLSTYMLDWEDLDNDGYTDDELLLDSLEIQNYLEYLSYRHTWKEHFILHYPSNALIVDSSWVIIFNDTVMSRYVSYGDHFFEERVADKYGVILQQDELAYPIILTGAIIDCVKYGNIVSIENHDHISQPHKQELYQNYPNPFNSMTTIEYMITKTSPVELKIFDILGNTILNKKVTKQNPGRHELMISASDWASGIYFYKIQAGEFTAVERMLLIK